MRLAFTFAPLLIFAAPAAAQSIPVQLPRELTDPAAMQKLSYEMQTLSNALLNVKIGDVRAAIEGREATPREHNMTLGDVARSKDPNFDRQLGQQVASVGPTVQRSMKALNRALPEMMRDLDHAKKSIERAVANLPDPTYPQR
ncbi:MAG TPA: hypothetical protein VM711_06790 [Sphingomicrobium sp.]|nr:hypothetical protein [Sphingomicrobium sp.]